MNAQAVIKSAWAKRFEASAPVLFDDALEHVLADGFAVAIVWDARECKYAVAPVHDTEFWLDAFATKREAEALCKEMDWPIADLPGKGIESTKQGNEKRSATSD